MDFFGLFQSFVQKLFWHRHPTNPPSLPVAWLPSPSNITESGDYIAIHSYYPRGRKHEPFRAAEAIHRRLNLPLLSGLFFPEALTTNDSGATPECGDEECTPGARRGNAIQMNGLATLLPRIWKKKVHPSSGGQHRAAAFRGRKATFAHLREAFRHPVGAPASIRSVNKVKMYVDANAVNISSLAGRIDTSVNSRSPLPLLLLLYYDSWLICWKIASIRRRVQLRRWPLHNKRCVIDGSK